MVFATFALTYLAVRTREGFVWVCMVLAWLVTAITLWLGLDPGVY